MERKIESIEDLSIILEGEDINQTLGKFVADANADPELGDDPLDPRYAFCCAYWGYNGLSLKLDEVRQLDQARVKEGLALQETVNPIWEDRDMSIPDQMMQAARMNAWRMAPNLSS